MRTYTILFSTMEILYFQFKIFINITLHKSLLLY
nr:MAG TPA: hypothetical protein [Caudoviricetes sp.]